MIGNGLAVLLTLATFNPMSHAAPAPAQNQPLDYLDRDAGIILSIVPSALPTLYKLATLATPSQKTTFNLAVLATTMAIHFNPLQPKQWQSKGISANEAILVQVAALSSAASPGLPQWNKTRIVIPSPDTARLASTLLALGLRESLPIEDNPSVSTALGTRFGLSNRAAKTFHKALLKSDVFLISKASPIAGTLFASKRGGVVLLDILSPVQTSSTPMQWTNSRHRRQVLTLLRRRPRQLHAGLPGADALAANALGLWLRPKQLSNSLSSIPQKQACPSVQALSQSSYFDSVSASLSILSKAKVPALQGKVQWHWPGPPPSWTKALSTTPAPLLADPKASLQLDLFASDLGIFRSTTQAPTRWVRFWQQSRLCKTGYRGLAFAVAWPQIVGMFARDLSALSPKTDTLLSSIGSLRLSVVPQPKGQAPHQFAEVWLRAPGNAIASEWMQLLFGPATLSTSQTSWGAGPLFAYAIDRPGGAVLGSALSSSARQSALDGIRQPSLGSRVIARAVARPSALAQSHASTSWRSLWQHWHRGDASLTRKANALVLRLDLK